VTVENIVLVLVVVDLVKLELIAGLLATGLDPVSAFSPWYVHPTRLLLIAGVVPVHMPPYTTSLPLFGNTTSSVSMVPQVVRPDPRLAIKI